MQGFDCRFRWFFGVGGTVCTGMVGMVGLSEVRQNCNAISAIPSHAQHVNGLPCRNQKVDEIQTKKYLFLRVRAEGDGRNQAKTDAKTQDELLLAKGQSVTQNKGKTQTHIMSTSGSKMEGGR